MLTLVKETDPILKVSCQEFDFEAYFDGFDSSKDYLIDFTDKMFSTMFENEGIGLASPQVGVNHRLFIMRVDAEDFICINPKIIENGSEDVVYPEGCLSFPELKLNIKRPESVYVRYQVVDGSELSRNLTGMASRCFQHELDHLNGITFDSRVSKLGLKMAREKRSKLMKKLLRKGS